MQAVAFVRSIYHASVCLYHQGITVYVDPYKVRNHTQDADFIIITHIHEDHYSPKDIAKVANANTRFITNAQVGSHLQTELAISPLHIFYAPDTAPSLQLCDAVFIEFVRAENKNHPVGFGFGAVLAFFGLRYYFSGDTDVLADIASDVAFIVCDGTYNMPNFEATVPAQLISMKQRPSLVIPYHYGDFPGTAQNGALLLSALQNAGFSGQLLIP